jgi:hypothetical protein
MNLRVQAFFLNSLTDFDENWVTIARSETELCTS